MFTPQSEIRDDSSLNNSNSTTTTSRSGNIFSSLKFSKNLLNPSALSRISRMNSIGSDSQISSSLSVATTNQLPSPFVQHITVTPKPLVDSTPITDEKCVSVLTDPMEINLRDILINLQHFIIQPYINLLNAQPNVRNCAYLKFISKTILLKFIILGKTYAPGLKRPLSTHSTRYHFFVEFILFWSEYGS